jgi:N-acetylglucosamine-6-phosphate deacetylase
MTICGMLPGESRLVGVTVANGKVVNTTADTGTVSSAVIARPSLICPGFIDVQVNGLDGIAFNDPALTTAQVERVTRKLWQNGVALYCPTLITDSFENLTRGLAAIARARRESSAAKSILGIHLEGPYLSPEDGPRGAHAVAELG